MAASSQKLSHSEELTTARAAVARTMYSWAAAWSTGGGGSYGVKSGTLYFAATKIKQRLEEEQKAVDDLLAKNVQTETLSANSHTDMQRLKAEYFELKKEEDAVAILKDKKSALYVSGEDLVKLFCIDRLVQDMILKETGFQCDTFQISLWDEEEQNKSFFILRFDGILDVEKVKEEMKKLTGSLPASILHNKRGVTEVKIELAHLLVFANKMSIAQISQAEKFLASQKELQLEDLIVRNRKLQVEMLRVCNDYLLAEYIRETFSHYNKKGGMFACTFSFEKDQFCLVFGNNDNKEDVELFLRAVIPEHTDFKKYVKSLDAKKGRNSCAFAYLDLSCFELFKQRIEVMPVQRMAQGAAAAPQA